MMWIYIAFIGSLIYAISVKENPLSVPLFWITGLIIAARWIFKWRSARPQKKPLALTTASPTLTPPPVPELDMFEGFRNWKEDDGPPEVAISCCALYGRSPSYLRFLLAAGALRNDTPGGIVAAAARRLCMESNKTNDSGVSPEGG